MEKQAIRPYSCSFFAAKTQAPTKDEVPLSMVKSMKQKNHHNPEQKIEHEEFQSKSKKPRTSETSSSKSSPTEKEGLLFFVNDIVPSNVTTDCEREVFWTKKNHSQEEEVSTELSLFDESWYTRNRKLMEDSAYNYSASILTSKKTLSRDALAAELNQKVVACKIAAMKFYTPGEEEEERRMGVSTKLKLYEDLYEDPFKIKKKLTDSDLGNLSRLLLGSSSVKDHVFPFFSIDHVNEIEKDKGRTVIIWDQDTSSEHTLHFKKWLTSRSYILNGKWKKYFVKRRDLKVGDEIGLYWDIDHSRFNFSVLKRVPRNQLVVN